MSAVAVVTKAADQSSDDHELVAAVRAGDDRAFELLFARYHGRIESYVRGMVRDHGRAEDVTQEVFIAALRRMRETERDINFKPWVYEIAKNACIDAFRRSRNTHEVSFDADGGLAPADHGRLVAGGSAPDVLVDTKIAIDDLCGAFGALSQTHHDILVMREFDGLSYREIGERLGMSRAGVESTLFRARRRLGEEYEQIVTGERCLRVRSIVDDRTAHVVGLRDRRRMARHVSYCQPCRRYARMAGVELADLRPSAAARIAALLPPLPMFLKRRVDDAGSVLGGHSGGAAQFATVLDPAVVAGWSRAVATAASVAVAGLGAGAAVGDRQGFAEFVKRAPGIVGMAPERAAPSADGNSPVRAGARPGSAPAAEPDATSSAGRPGHATDSGAEGERKTSGQSDPKNGAPDAAGSPTAAPATSSLRGAVDDLPDVTTPPVDAADDTDAPGSPVSDRDGRNSPPGSGAAHGASPPDGGSLSGIARALGSGGGADPGATGAAGVTGEGAAGAGSGLDGGAAGVDAKGHALNGGSGAVGTGAPSPPAVPAPAQAPASAGLR